MEYQLQLGLFSPHKNPTKVGTLNTANQSRTLLDSRSRFPPKPALTDADRPRVVETKRDTGPAHDDAHRHLDSFKPARGEHDGQTDQDTHQKHSADRAQSEKQQIRQAQHA